MTKARTYIPRGDFTTTEFWRYGKGCYMFKTENSNLKRLLSRRKSAEVSSFCYEPRWKIFKLKYSCLRAAKEAFKYFTGTFPVYDESRDVYITPQSNKSS